MSLSVSLSFSSFTVCTVYVSLLCVPFSDSFCHSFCLNSSTRFLFHSVAFHSLLSLYLYLFLSVSIYHFFCLFLSVLLISFSISFKSGCFCFYVSLFLSFFLFVFFSMSFFFYFLVCPLSVTFDLF